MTDIRLALLAGIDIPLPQLKLVMHQPSIKEIAYMGESDFFSALHYFCLNKQDLVQDESLLENMSNFQVLMKVINQPESKDKKQMMITLLALLFPQYKATVTPNSILLFSTEAKITIALDDSNFNYFQDILKSVMCIQNIFQGDNVVYNPANAKAREIAEKIYKGRKKVAALKAKENSGSALARYVSILTIGLNSMTLEDCLNLTMFQLFDLIERYNLYVSWDTDLRIRLAGGDPKKETENWMKNIH